MVELLLLAPADRVDAVTDALVDELGALAASVADADAGTDAEQPIFGEPGLPAPAPAWTRSVVQALFPTGAAATEAATRLLAHDFARDVHVQALRDVPDTDWVRTTQAQFAPVEAAPGFWIVPSWHAVPQGARQVIRLDPGLAFGTGTHPTTRMCLRWIATRADAATLARVLDYGCGSGILAIAAAKCGARAVDAVDIDPAAVAATRDNAAANGVALAAVGLPDAARGGYSLVVANILATPLALLAPLLAAHVAAGGALLLAGLLARQADALRATYAPWIALAVADHEDGWALLAGRRPGGAAG